MTTELLARLGARGVRLWLEGGKLRYEGPPAALPPEVLDELRGRREEIVRFLRAAGPSAEADIPVTDPSTPAPLSPAQRRLYFLDRLEPSSVNYNLTSAFLLEGPIQVNAFARSLEDVTARHEILRTRFDETEDRLVQIVTDWTPALQIVDLSGWDPETARSLLATLIGREAVRPFAVAEGPHLRVALVRLDATRHAVLVNMHHVVSDDASIAVFVRDWRAAYIARRAGRAPSLPPLRVQYRDFAAWVAARANALDDQLEYWRRALADSPALLQLPTDRPRRQSPRQCGSCVQVRPDRLLAERLAEVRARAGATLNHCCHAAFAATLFKYSGQGDAVIGVPVTNRTRRDLEPLIGPFINVAPIRIVCSDAIRLCDLLDCVRNAVIDALDHAEVPFEQIVAAVAPDRSLSHAPLFNVLFAFEQAPADLVSLPDLKTTPLQVDTYAAKYDLVLVIQPDADGLTCAFKYNVDLFDRTTIERLARHYLSVLMALADQPQLRLGELCLLSEEEGQQLRLWNQTDRSYPLDTCVHHVFEQRAREAAGSIALDFEDRPLTYGETNRMANRLAHRLRNCGVGPETIVGIRADRSLEMVIAVLGVLKAGAAYLPIDPEYPAGRQQFMLEDSGVTVVLTTRAVSSSDPAPTNALYIEDVLAETGLPETNPPQWAAPINPAYVTYTSGSTGVPKAVVTEHRAIANNLLWMQEHWPIGPCDALLLKAAFSFDVSFKEILWPLMFGARLVVARPGGHRDPAYLQDVIARKAVSVVHLVPTMLDQFLREERPAESLRIVMCGGEALIPELRDRFVDRYGAGLLHLYGPTETAIAVTGVLYTRGHRGSAITLGHPMANCQIYILDGALNQVPIGVVGELYVGGVPVARGYHRRPALTAERFVPDRFSGRPGGRLYRTGDFARRLPDGDIQFIGRADHQIKLHGLRLELGEIENALRERADVHDALVVVHRDGERAALAAYIEPAGNPWPSTQEIARFLRGRLPAYMVPATYTLLKAIPTSPNGKADRSALPPPGLSGGESPDNDPPTEVERRLIELWRAVLGAEHVGRHDRFFDIGGHSILLLQLHKRVRETFGCEITVTDLFLHPTVAEMAALLSADPVANAAVAVRPVRTSSADHAGIAVVGMAGRFPGAPDPGEFWRNLAAGVESIRTFTVDELVAEGLEPDVVGSDAFVKARGYLEDADQFDHAFFDYSPAEAAILDPQFRLLLECAQHAMDDAAYDPEALARTGCRIGSYVAVSRSSYFLNNLQTHRDLIERMGATRLAIATDKSFAAAHLAYRLNLKGPALTVDTACSSSLVAVHHACVSLANHDCDVALAGGVSIDVPLKGGHIFQDGGIGSPDGHCRPFDRDAAGTVRGCGGGLVVLKRMADAVADGDFIYAVIRGTAVNNDGAAKIGFTAPSCAGQAEVIGQALRAAGVEPEEIGYIETHGTGTTLGDPIEFAALSKVFRGGRIVLGAVKANIGHLDAAAGVAGLIKACLVLRNRQFPPLVNFVAPNPEIPLEASPFWIPRALEEWTATTGPRRAGVSSFGIGGTNAHAILEEALPPRKAASDGPELICLAGRTDRAARNAAAQLARHVTRTSCTLREIAFALSQRRHDFSCRRAFVCSTPAQLVSALEQYARSGVTPETADGSPQHGRDGSSVHDVMRLQELGQAWEAHAPVDWSSHFARFGDPRTAGYRRVPLPGYPFERQRFWIDRRRPTPEPAASVDESLFDTAGWIREPLPITPVPPTCWLVFTDGSTEAHAVVARLKRDGHATVVVVPGDRLTVDNERHVTMDPSDGEHLARMFEALRARGARPWHAIDFWSSTGLKRDVPDAARGGLARSLRAIGWRGNVGLITRGAFSVTGTETLDPYDGLVAGLAATLSADDPCQSIVIDIADADRDSAVRRLAREVTAVRGSGAVAYRGTHRWVSSRRPVAFGDLVTSGAAASGGVYLIVDGVTDFGVSIAEHLAWRGADRIAILGFGSDAVPTVTARLKRLRDAGATVTIVDAPPAHIDGVFYNLVDTAQSRSALDGLSAGSAVALCACAIKIGALFEQLPSHPAVGVVCGVRQVADGLRHFVAAASPAGNRWTIVTSDAWSPDRRADHSLTAATLAVASGILSSESVGDIHVGSGLARRIAGTADPGRAEMRLSETEGAIARAWQEVIGRACIGPDDDFFAIGGDSLMATQAAARLSRVFGIALSPDTFYDQPTIRSLASLVDRLLTAGGSSATVPAAIDDGEVARELLEL